MNIDSDKIDALYQLSVDKTFSKASETLGISQPALSKKIIRLEDELQTNLVIRGTRGITLTQAGVEIIKYYKLKRDLDFELLEKLSQNKGMELIGEINIATQSSLGRSVILPCLSNLVKNYKNLKINFLIKETRELEATLLSGEANFIISNEQVNRENIINKKVGDEENVHITPTSPNYPEFYLDHDQYDQTTINFLKINGKSLNIKRNYFDDVYGIIDAVKHGYGQAIVSKHLIKNKKSIKVKKYRKKMIAPIYLSYYDRSYFPTIHNHVIKELENIKNFL